jgi:predicted ATPase/DNA-binding CsgD family transcriptional regulator
MMELSKGCCVACSAVIEDPDGKRVYCSNACRQRAYRLRNRKRSASAASNPVTTATTNSRSPRAAFVGRQRELRQLAAIVRARRLVTIFGPAGAGKSRLASEFAGANTAGFRDGVHVIELVTFAGPEAVSRAIAQALGVMESPRSALIDSLAAALRVRHVLLVLDNCEHLVDAGSDVVAALLSRCPGVHILATSREILQLPGENVFPLAGLPIDDAEQLFYERAGASMPHQGSSVDRRRARATCERLDRLPLAIELAADLAWDPGCVDVVDQLARPRPGDTENDAFGRKATSLYWTIDWSYRRLGPDEQALLRRLSVLPGGFDLHLAKAVAADLALPVVELIATLESKSLIAPASSPSGIARFRQWESVRLYAQRRLNEQDESTLARERLVAALSEIAAPLADLFVVPAALIERMLVEQANLEYALDSLDGSDDPRRPLLATALVRSRASAGIVTDSGDRLAAALSVTSAPASYRTLAYAESAWEAAWRGDQDGSRAFALQAVTLAHRCHPLLRARALNALAVALQVSGQYAEAVASFARCLELVRANGAPLNVALSMHNLAWARMLAGHVDEAAALVADAVPIYRREGVPVRLAAILHTSGVIELQRGNLTAARRCFVDGIECLTDYRTPIALELLEGLGVAALRDGRWKAGRWEHGLRLIGVAAMEREDRHVCGDRWWREQVADAVLAVKARRPGQDVDRALAEGRLMSVAEAIHDVLSRCGDQPVADDVSTLLSLREREVAALVAHGSTNEEIGTLLRISGRTVESHLDHVRTKLRLRSRAEVAAWAARHLPVSV